MLDQAQARDAALDLLQRHRSELIRHARAVAINIAWARGEVSSTEVWEELRRRGEVDLWLKYAMAAVDPRWMGVVFRHGWKRLRWTSTGSHKRPVAVWVLSEAA